MTTHKLPRHKLDEQLVFDRDDHEGWVRHEKTLCGIPVIIPGTDLSCTWHGEFDCEDCKEVFALYLLADLP